MDISAPASELAERDTAFNQRGVWEVPRLLRLWHLASLDAPTVAVVWSFGFGWAAHVRLPIWIVAVQALGVWAVYLADRMLDARRAVAHGDLSSLRERHFFHWRWRHRLTPAAVAAACAAGFLIVQYMPAAARERNAVLAATACAYFAGVHGGRQKQSSTGRGVRDRRSAFGAKEMLVGCLFTAGCALPTLARGGSQRGPLLAAVAFFGALAWLNCHAIESWEGAGRDSTGQVTRMAAGLFGAGLVLAALPVAEPRVSLLLVTGSVAAALLAALDRMRTRLSPVALRALADLVLLTPAALIFPQR